MISKIINGDLEKCLEEIDFDQNKPNQAIIVLNDEHIAIIGNRHPNDLLESLSRLIGQMIEKMVKSKFKVEVYEQLKDSIEGEISCLQQKNKTEQMMN